MDIKQCQKDCAAIALKRGKIEEIDDIEYEQIIDAAIEELMEAKEALANKQIGTSFIQGKPIGFFTELVDTVRVIFTGFQCSGVDFEETYKTKDRYERIRKD